MTARQSVAVVVGWFVLALVVMVRLLQHGDVTTAVCAWSGGVLSVLFAQLLWQRASSSGGGKP